MNILITGGTGFIGSYLCDRLMKQGHNLVIKTRFPLQVKSPFRAIDDLSELSYDECFDIVINMAGEPIADKRWSVKQKNKIQKSRISTTEGLVSYFRRVQNKPSLFISASAIGYYGISNGDGEHTEESKGDNSFASQLCLNWERCALEANELGIRTCILRIGIVLGNNGGALNKMLPPFKFGFGGNIGSGKQWMSWIHLTDLVGIIEYCIRTDDIEGPINCTAPVPVRNATFSKALAEVLNRPYFFHMPSFAVKMIFGDMGEELLLAGEKVLPNKLKTLGFTFKYETIDRALADILIVG